MSSETPQPEDQLRLLTEVIEAAHMAALLTGPVGFSEEERLSRLLPCLGVVRQAYLASTGQINKVSKESDGLHVADPWFYLLRRVCQLALGDIQTQAAKHAGIRVYNAVAYGSRLGGQPV